jgi:hypothetical protein
MLPALIFNRPGSAGVWAVAGGALPILAGIGTITVFRSGH